MSVIEWKGNFSVKIKAIDEQHKKLVGMINVLHDAMRQGKGMAVIGITLDELAEYTVFHFATEEELMTRFSFPGLAAHKREHEACVARVPEFKKKLADGSMGLSIDVISFLVDWLNHHILDVDKQYSEFLNKKGMH